jgi:hypothetical protein
MSLSGTSKAFQTTSFPSNPYGIVDSLFLIEPLPPPGYNTSIAGYHFYNLEK